MMPGSSGSCYLENPCCPVSFEAKTEKGPEKNSLSGTLKKLSSSFPVGMCLGPGYCLMWETANNIFLLKSRLASNQVVLSPFHREKSLSSHRP